MRLYSDQNVQHIQQLTLVFVQTLGLRVEQGIGVEGGVLMTGQPGAEILLVLMLDVRELLKEGGIVRKRHQIDQALGILDPLIADGLADQLGQARVGATSASGGA